MPSIFREIRPRSVSSPVERARALVDRYGSDARGIVDGWANRSRDRHALRQMREWRKVGVLIDTLLAGK